MERLTVNIRQCAEKRAKDTLECGGNRLKLIVGLLLCVALTVVMWGVSDMAEMLMCHFFEDARFCSLIANVFLYLLIIFTVTPVYLGLFFVAARMLREENTDITDIFDCFSSLSMYGRALSLVLNIFVRVLPIILALRAPYVLSNLSVLADISQNLYGFGAKAVSVAVSAILVLPVSSSFGFVGFAELYSNQSVRKAVKMARDARKRNYSHVFSLAYSTLFKLLLSLLTIGVVTVIHTIPLSLLRYAAMANELDNNEPTGMI